MSVEVTTLAWYVEGITPAQKAVLVALADHADDYGRNAYPGVARLVVKTSYAERTVRRALSDLRDIGLIKVQKEATQHSATWYCLDLPEMHLRANKEYARPARNAPLENPDLPENTPDLPENTARPARNAPEPSLIRQEPSLLDDLPESTPLPTLLRHFTELTSFFPPSDSTPNFESKWRRPLMAILEKADGDIERAKGTITQAVKLLRDKKYSISSPFSIQTAAVNILSGVSGNGNGGNYLPLWKPIEAEIRRNGRRSTKKWDETTTRILRRAGGFPALCNMSFIDAERAFSAAYKDTT